MRHREKVLTRDVQVRQQFAIELYEKIVELQETM